MISIKIAEDKDIGVVFNLVKEGIQETDDRFYPVENDVLMRNIIESMDIAPTFIAYKDSKPIGLASLSLGRQLWSDKPYLTTNMVHVLRGYRNFAIINKLYIAIRKYADLQGILYIDNFYGKERVDGMIRLAKSQKLDVIGLSIIYKGEK